MRVCKGASRAIAEIVRRQIVLWNWTFVDLCRLSMKCTSHSLPKVWTQCASSGTCSSRSFEVCSETRLIATPIHALRENNKVDWAIQLLLVAIVCFYANTSLVSSRIHSLRQLVSRSTSYLSSSSSLHFDFNAALTAGTSSSRGRIGGSGPSGVMENGLICLCDFV